MAKERFSKLQKWILTTALKNEGGLFRADIALHYFGSRTPSAEVSVTRAVWSLIKKGLIEGHGPYFASGEEMLVAYTLVHENDFTKESLDEYIKTLPVKGKKRFWVTNDQEAAGDKGKRARNKEIHLTPRGKEMAVDLLNAKSGT